eukprot:12629478-Ditylum_brightwellii.AAC.1
MRLQKTSQHASYPPSSHKYKYISSLKVINQPTRSNPAPPYPLRPDILWEQLYLHFHYHPNNKKSYKYQQVFTKTLKKPHYHWFLTSLHNMGGTKVNINPLVVAHSRAHNLGNLLSYRRLDSHINPPA